VKDANVTDPDQGGGRAAEGSGTHNLLLRVGSAALLAPVALACAFIGGWLFAGLCVIAAGGILWEWALLVAARADPRILAPGWAGLFIAAALAGLGLPGAASGTIVIEAVLAGLAVAAWPGGDDSLSPVGWAAAGVVYAGAALIPPITLRNDPELGLTALLFLFATVWITDIFAYFCGRAIGGTLLWPKVSPKKTWAGATGGLAGGVVAGVAVAYASGIAKLGIIGVMAALLSVLAQAGDLFESWIKRRFGAKDASGLIPGHGGLMDRLDGFLVAALAALLIGLLRAGTGSPARGLLVW
jgi:phosphatidate cytidylyltransferase